MATVREAPPQQRAESPMLPPRRRAQALVGLAVFTAGAVALATELAAARAVAPDFGSSTASWAGVIGVVLAALMLGSLLGGRLASTEASARTIVMLLLAASVLIAAPAFAGPDVIARVAEGAGGWPFWVGSALAVSFLYAPSVVVLGAVTPVATLMLSRSVAEAGRAAGRVYAVSAVGSLVGVFGSGQIALPLIGTRATLLGGALALTAVGLLLATTRDIPLRRDR